MIRFSAVVAVCVLLVAGSIVSAQAPAAPGQTPGQPPGQGQAGRGGGAPQPPMTNLQVFPADTPRPQVVQTMQAFTQALGVTCAHCHVWVGTNDPTERLCHGHEADEERRPRHDSNGARHQPDGAESRGAQDGRRPGGQLHDVPSGGGDPHIAAAGGCTRSWAGWTWRPRCPRRAATGNSRRTRSGWRAGSRAGLIPLTFRSRRRAPLRSSPTS